LNFSPILVLGPFSASVAAWSSAIRRSLTVFVLAESICWVGEDGVDDLISIVSCSRDLALIDLGSSETSLSAPSLVMLSFCVFLMKCACAFCGIVKAETCTCVANRSSVEEITPCLIL